MPLVDYLNRKEMQALLGAPNPNTREGVRDRAMLHVAYAAGLRVSELVGLRLDNLAFDPALSIHVLGKGRRERALPLWRETAIALRAWLAQRPAGQATEVFLNARGTAMTARGSNTSWKNMCGRPHRIVPVFRQRAFPRIV